VEVTRAVSTVLDASMAILLVSAAAVALVAIPDDASRPADPDATARTVLASTANASYYAESGSPRTASGRVATLLGHAAVSKQRGGNARFVSAVETAVAEVLANVDCPVALTATAGNSRVTVGQNPPPSASVAAVTHRVAVGNTSALVSVRTWSP
jgi:hypothetical protein